MVDVDDGDDEVVEEVMEDELEVVEDDPEDEDEGEGEEEEEEEEEDNDVEVDAEDDRVVEEGEFVDV